MGVWRGGDDKGKPARLSVGPHLEVQNLETQHEPSQAKSPIAPKLRVFATRANNLFFPQHPSCVPGSYVVLRKQRVLAYHAAFVEHAHERPNVVNSVTVRHLVECLVGAATAPEQITHSPAHRRERCFDRDQVGIEIHVERLGERRYRRPSRGACRGEQRHRHHQARGGARLRTTKGEHSITPWPVAGPCRGACPGSPRDSTRIADSGGPWHPSSPSR